MLKLARRYRRRPNLTTKRAGDAANDPIDEVLRDTTAARPGPVWLPVPVDGKQYWLVPVEQS